MARTILITGCSSGIGHRCAHGMQERGWRVFATARSSDDVARLTGEGLDALRLDYTDPSSIEDAFGETLERTGGTLDAVFNNGGYAQPGAVEDLSLEALKAQFETNVFGPHEVTRRAVPVMRAQGGGRIVQCSSIFGFVTAGFRGAYCASKHALESLAEALRIEVEGSGIRVSVIEPGPIESRMGANALIAFKRWIDPEGSPHEDYYARRAKALKTGGDTRFQLPPDAVLGKLAHACEAKNPRPRYYVTTPTYVMEGARRLLPSRAMGRLMARATS